MARLSSELVLSLTDRVTGPARGVGRAMEGLRRTTAANAVGMDRAGGMLLASGRLLAGGGVALGAKEAITAAADFETQLTEIGKKGGYTAEQLAKIGAEAKALSSSGKVASSLEDIMSGYNRAAAAGIPLAEMGQFVQLTTKVGDAFEMSGEDASNAFLGFNKTVGLGFDQMERYADLINSLADSGIADEKQIVGFIDRAGASLKAAGLTKEQIAAFGATAANIKMPEDVAANTFSTLVNKLLSPGSPKAQKALADIVGNVGDFNKLLKKDTNKALESFLQSVAKLDKFKGAELLGGFIGAGYDDEVMRVAAAYGEIARNRELAEGDSYAGSLTKSYQAKLKTFWSQWQVAKNALNELAIDAGTMGMPAVMTILGTAKGVIGEIDAGLKGFRAQVDIAEVLKAYQAIQGLTSSIGSLLSMGAGGSIIERTFDRLAGAANTLSAGVNLVVDGLQAVGLVGPDGDTGAQIQRRFDNIVDGMTTGPAGGVVRSVYDAATNRVSGPEMAGRQSAQDHAIAQSAATRGVSIAQVRAEIETVARQRAARTGQPYRDPFPRDPFAPQNLPPLAYPTQAPKSLRAPAIPVPQPRPDIVGSIRDEGARAAQEAEAAGQRIQNAFAVTAEAKVTVDTRGIDAAQAALNRLLATAGQVGPAIRAANRAAAESAEAPSGRTSRLRDDTSHYGD